MRKFRHMKLLTTLLTTLAILPCWAVRIDVATMAIGDWYQAATLPGLINKEAYCEKHGYPFHAYSESKDESRPIPWTKVLIVLELLDDPEVEYVFWTDADSLIMNSDIKLKGFIDKRYDLVIATDNDHLNSGQFLIRNCDWSKDFLQRIYAKEEFITNGWWEQASMIDEFAKNKSDRKHVKYLKQRSMNSISYEQCQGEHAHWHDGDFIVHFMGARDQQLVDLMRKYAPMAR
jgi:galactosyl transferase GMA12/MNN10 family